MQGITWPDGKRYVVAFDGIRGVAVLLVIIFHTRAMLGPVDLGLFTVVAKAGFVGVDFFFTLSGFLITGILLRTREQPGYFRNFYVRRLLRIFPLYYGLVTLVLGSRMLAGVASVHPWWSFYGFISNFFVARAQAEDFALDVSWSLSVEEQFYLMWPAIVTLVPRRAFVGIVAAITLLSPVARSLLHDPTTTVSYMDTWCRLDALAIGALGAVLWEERSVNAVLAARALVWPAVALLGLLIVSGVMDPLAAAWAVPGPSLVAIAVCVVLLAIASGGAPSLRAALEWWPLLHIGRVSYGMYLLHTFLLGILALVWPRLPVPEPSESVLASVVAFTLPPVLVTAVATLVFRTIEQPFLSLKDRLAPYRREAAP